MHAKASLAILFYKEGTKSMPLKYHEHAPTTWRALEIQPHCHASQTELAHPLQTPSVHPVRKTTIANLRFSVRVAALPKTDAAIRPELPVCGSAWLLRILTLLLHTAPKVSGLHALLMGSCKLHLLVITS